MSWLNKLFGKKDKSAKVAKERLMIAIATDRKTTMPEIENMRRDIIAVLQKYLNIDTININKEEKDDVELIEIEVLIKKGS